MKYRRLDDNHDMVLGGGTKDYLQDSVGNPEAVAQAIKTSLLLFKGEWWMDLSDGLPLWQKILGQRPANKSIIDRILVDRIMSVRLPEGGRAVRAVNVVSSEYDAETRGYKFSCDVETVYGLLHITNTGGI